MSAELCEDQLLAAIEFLSHPTARPSRGSLKCDLRHIQDDGNRRRGRLRLGPIAPQMSRARVGRSAHAREC